MSRKKRPGNLLIPIMIFIAMLLAGTKMVDNAVLIKHRQEGANSLGRNIVTMLDYTDEMIKPYIQDGKEYLRLKRKDPSNESDHASDLQDSYGWAFKTMGTLQSSKDFIDYLKTKTKYTDDMYDPVLVYDAFKYSEEISVEVGEDLEGASGCPQSLVFTFDYICPSKVESGRLKAVLGEICSNFNSSRGGNSCRVSVEGDLSNEIIVKLAYIIRDDSDSTVMEMF